MRCIHDVYIRFNVFRGGLYRYGMMVIVLTIVTCNRV